MLGLAGRSEVLVSWTTRDLLSVTSLGFEERGTQQLKGLPDPKPIYAVVAGSA